DNAVYPANYEVSGRRDRSGLCTSGRPSGHYRVKPVSNEADRGSFYGYRQLTSIVCKQASPKFTEEIRHVGGATSTSRASTGTFGCRAIRNFRLRRPLGA